MTLGVGTLHERHALLNINEHTSLYHLIFLTVDSRKMIPVWTAMNDQQLITCNTGNIFHHNNNDSIPEIPENPLFLCGKISLVLFP